MEHEQPPFFVITGGPGSGKTTLLAELARRGCRCVPEDARAVIQEQMAAGGDALPWTDAPRFAALLMERSITTWQMQVEAWSKRQTAAPFFFDRGVGDAFACAAMIGAELPDALEMRGRGCRYREPVFLAPWWPEIYKTDAERRQTRAEAEETERAIEETYCGLGYRVAQLPLLSAAARADFVLASVANLEGSAGSL